MIIIKATKSKSKKQFQHGVRIVFLPATVRELDHNAATKEFVCNS